MRNLVDEWLIKKSPYLLLVFVIFTALLFLSGCNSWEGCQDALDKCNSDKMVMINGIQRDYYLQYKSRIY